MKEGKKEGKKERRERRERSENKYLIRSLAQGWNRQRTSECQQLTWPAK